MNTKITDWKNFPWHPYLSWVGDLESLTIEEFEFLRLVQKGLAQEKFLNWISIKERSIELTGDPNQLMKLSKTALFADGCLTWSILSCYTGDVDTPDRSTWHDELRQLAQIRESVFNILASDRVRYKRYNSVYDDLSQASKILEQITDENKNGMHTTF